MSSGHYSSQAQGSSSFSDDDDDLVFQDGYQDQDHDDEDMDVDMSYLQNSSSHSNSSNHQPHLANNMHNMNNMNNMSYFQAGSAGNSGNTYFNSNSNAHNGMAHNTSSSNLNQNHNHNNNNNNSSSSNNSSSNHNITDSNTSNTNGVNTGTEPKVRKKPGRKPGPTCPALRKEQNRAAQRAFRDRKERHLHQLENMIKDLKNQHFLVISQYQRDAHHLKAMIESLQSENYYLREVVFAFESALSKGNHIDILKDVKHELFRRHHESRTAAAAAAAAEAKSLSSASPAQSKAPSQADLPATPATPGTPATPTMTSVSSSSNSAASVAPTTPGSSARSVSPAVAVKPSLSPSLSSASIASPSPALQESSSHPITDADDRHEPKKPVVIMDHYSEEGIYSMSGDILYKAPPLFIPDMSSDGKLSAPISPFEPLSVPRPIYRPPGTNLPQHTDYTKHPTVFDELQSSLFPPGTLESLHINMATPQEVVSDESLFADPVEAEEGSSSGYMSVEKDSASGAAKANAVTDSRTFKGKRSKDGHEDDYEDEEKDDGDDGTERLSQVAAVLGLKWDSGTKHRLHKELCVLVGAEPQTDPNIDPKVYEFPHDKRIDFIPCPKLRAQMIVHQHRYNADEVFQLLLDEAVCWGPPLHKDSWQLPDAFFDRFGFLLGIELERIRSKTYPPVKRQ
ncbi:hypothetical protein EC968_007742 [Mortierella alpina]|nr:hypothetical protein EC968_007742 [Mortierella alpina]